MSLLTRMRAMTKRKTEAEKAITKTVVAKTTKAISLDDLNNDPSVIANLSDAVISRLQKEAEHTQYPLGGSVRQALNARFNESNAEK